MSSFLLPALAVLRKRKLRQSLVPRVIWACKSKGLIQLVNKTQNSKSRKEDFRHTFCCIWWAGLLILLMLRFITSLNLRVSYVSVHCISNEVEQFRGLKVIHGNLSDTAAPFLHPYVVPTLACLLRAGQGQVQLHQGSQIF